MKIVKGEGQTRQSNGLMGSGNRDNYTYDDDVSRSCGCIGTHTGRFFNGGILHRKLSLALA